MTIFNVKRNNILLILFPILLLLITSFFMATKDESKSLINISNVALPLLSKENRIQFKTVNDSIYSAQFYETDFERKFVLIKKSPTYRSYHNQVKIHVYPKNKSHFKTVKNYNSKGYLDFSASVEPIKHVYDYNEYSVLTINLPFINVDSIVIDQKNEWHKVYKNPFTNIKFKSSKNTTTPYKSILFDFLKKEDILYVDVKKTPNLSFVSITQKRLFWNAIYNNSPDNYNNHITIKGKNKNKINSILTNFNDGKKQFNDVFHIPKLTSYLAIMNLFGNNKNIKLNFILKDNLLEPVYINDNQIGLLNSYVTYNYINDQYFQYIYAQKLNEISTISIANMLNDIPNLSENIKNYDVVNPSSLFEKNIFLHNQMVLKKDINPAIGLKAVFLKKSNKAFTVSIKNLSAFPIRIKGLMYKKKLISKTNQEVIIFPKKTDTVSFFLPRSFENLFVQKKKKTMGFIFGKNISELFIFYNLNGLNKIKYTEIIPYQSLEELDEKTDLFRLKIDISSIDFLTIDNVKKTISFTKNCIIKTPLILPENYTITAKKGITITINNGGKIISNSPLQIIGTKENPIQFVSKDKKGQGILVLANGKKSKLQFVYFNGLTNPSHGLWETSSSITFYESPVDIDYCKISNNTCEDALNIVRSEFRLTNTYFFNTQSDAFDGDFTKGFINSCTFKNIGNDAIDVSGSDLKISNIRIIKARDKAISAGENSKIDARKIVISDCGIAIAGKDLSKVIIENISIKNTKLGFTAFQKKPEFGPSNIKVKSIKFDQVEIKYLIENTSVLVVDNDTIKTTQDNVKSRMYGVDFGVSSKETKNKKQDATK